ncbi:MAG: sugar ABC transporter permease, partial [Cyanobacteriota bacterium]
MAPFSAADPAAEGSKRPQAVGWIVPWLFLAPALLLLTLSVLLPAAMALLLSFTSSGLDVDAPLQFIGLANLRRLFSDPMMARVTLTTFLYLLG